MDALIRSLLSFLSPEGKNARLSILIYHRVLDEIDSMLYGVPSATMFSWQAALIARLFNVLPLAEAVNRLVDNCLPSRAACITFDDGYADNVTVALPILKQHGIPATFFIASGYLNGGSMWNDTVIESVRRLPNQCLDLSKQGLGIYRLDTIGDRASVAQQLLNRLKYLPWREREDKANYLASLAGFTESMSLMMTSQQVQQLHAHGMEIGAHTVTHPILSKVDTTVARKEIASGKERLEALIGERIKMFAYPNGKPGQDYQREHVDIVRHLGFTGAVTTAWGVSNRNTDPWQLPRFTPWDPTPKRFIFRLLWNYYSQTKPEAV